MGMIFDPYLGTLRDDRVTLAALAAVGAGPRYKVVGTLADMIAVSSPVIGDEALVTDESLVNILFRYGPSGWWLANDTTLYASSAYAAGLSTTTADQTIKQCVLPVGFMEFVSGMAVEVLFVKDNTTAGMTSYLRIGQTVGASGAQLLASGGMSAANRTLPVGTEFYKSSSGNVSLSGNQTANVNWSSIGSATAFAEKPVTGIEAAPMIISAAVSLSSTGSTPGVRMFRVRGFA